MALYTNLGQRVETTLLSVLLSHGARGWDEGEKRSCLLVRL